MNRPFSNNIYKGIRIIDLLVACVVIFCVTVGGYFLLRQGKYVNIVLRISDSGNPVVGPFSDASLWFGDAVMVGMAKHDVFGRKTVEVLDKRVYPTGERTKIVDLTMRVRAVYDKKSKQYSFDGSPLLVGSTQKFSLNSYLVRGLIRDVDGVAKRTIKKYRVQGILNPLFHNPALYGWASAGYTGTPNTTGIPLYLADAISVGDYLSDQKGHAIVKMVKIVKNPAFFVLVGQDIYSRLDMKSLEVQLEIEMQTEIVSGQPLYLGIYPLLVNASLPLYFPRYTVTLTVTNFEELK
jgi:hypothetical protein